MNSHANNAHGYLELVLGCMFSGKTSALIEIYKQYQLCQTPCLVVNFTGDTRYSDNDLSTHDKQVIPCVFTTNLYDLYSNEGSRHPFNNDVILINEGQFFDDLVPFVSDLINGHNKKVYVCGLDGDFQRNKFGTILDLIPQADHYRKLLAICIQCKNGTRAAFTHRLTDSKEQTVIGSGEYIPLCRKCYNQHQGVTIK